MNPNTDSEAQAMKKHSYSKKMKRYFLATALLLCGCSLHRAILVNDLENKDKINTASNGFVCFRNDTDPENEFELDVKNESSGESYRLYASPRFNGAGLFIGPWKVAGRGLPKDEFFKNVMISQLPPGQYSTRYLYLTNPARGQKQSAQKVAKKEFSIAAGAVTYIGDFSMAVNWVPVLNFIKGIKYETKDGGDSIRVLLAKIEEYGISKMDVKNQIATIEPGK